MQFSREQQQAVLSQYDIDFERGFLPAQDPQIVVPKGLGSWCEVAADLPKLLVANCLRRTVETLPIVNADTLRTRAELERAMAAFSFIGHAYVWGEGAPPQALPASLAVPWCQVASRLERPPVLSYPSYALHNWRRLDTSKPIELGNIALVQNFLAGIDEEWFVVVHVDIEAKAAPAIAAIFPAQEAAKNGQGEELTTHLNVMDSALESMYATLLRMRERCDPYIYFHRVRPYIHGWKDHPLFPNGLLYTGVESYKGQPQYFRGETGAQSSIIPALDAVLGVVHENDRMRHYLDEMRGYMPPRHRAFIEAVEHGASVRDFVIGQGKSNPSLTSAYNKCVQWVEQFRNKHLEYARDYIFQQAQQVATNPSAVGTGGTPFIPYLEKHRDETGQHLLK